MKVSVILPAYNEGARLPSCLDRLLIYLASQDFDYEVIVLADGCTDDTERIAAEYATSDPHVILVSFPERLGKGGGILNAAHEATGDVLIYMDVDLATTPSEILLALRKMEEEGADIVYGSRYSPDSRILVQPPLHRKFLRKAFTFLFRLLFGIDLYDTQCGFKAIRRSVFNSLSNELKIKGFAFDVDLAVKAVRHGYRILEIPVTWSYMEGSKVDMLKQISELGRDLLTVWLEGRKRQAGEHADLRRY